MPVICIPYDDGTIPIPFKTVREMINLLLHPIITDIDSENDNNVDSENNNDDDNDIPGLVTISYVDDVLNSIYCDIHTNNMYNLFDINDVLKNPENYWIINYYRDVHNGVYSCIELDTQIRFLYRTHHIYIDKRTKTHMIQCFLSDIKYTNLELQEFAEKRKVEQYYKTADMVVLTIPEIIFSVDYFKQEIAKKLNIDKTKIIGIIDHACDDLYISDNNILSFVPEFNGYNCNHIWYIQIDGFKSKKKEEHESINREYNLIHSKYISLFTKSINSLEQSEQIKALLNSDVLAQYKPIDPIIKKISNDIDKLIDTLLDRKDGVYV
jgi:hypothetical protein